MRLPFSSAAARVASSALLSTLALAGCSPEQTPPAPAAGKADFSRHVAIGDNYLAGFSDGGLTASSQQYSIAALLDQQFALVSGQPSTFTQPLFAPGTGTSFLLPRGFDANGVLLTSRTAAGRVARGSFINANACGGRDTTFLYLRATNQLPQNLAVPFLRLTQIELAGLGNEANLQRIDQFNPFLERLLPAADNRTYLQAVTDGTANATFFTLFVGLGDVLPYILSGGECTTSNPNSAAIALMKTNVKKLLDKASDNGRRPGVISLAPQPVNQLPLLGRGSVVRVQAMVNATDTIYVQAPNAAGVVVVRPMAASNDYILPTGLAQFGKPQLVTLPNGSQVTVRYGLSKRNPIKRVDVLDSGEYGRVNQAVTTINEELVRLAKLYKLPIVGSDINVYDQIFKNIAVNGVVYTAEPGKGNFYSLDQYSLTPRGNAIMANAMLREINRVYGASVPLLDPNTLPTTARQQ
ncbi:hypothetical protein [Hymenobacter daecheongensis]|uniref:hypothetical protein n=1 Tax=Hymenobacter daecheongensis TaxID=496053 RepID=UPI0013562EC0|nr:hypothetical protein [Hymenobacter daecheongensis]